MRNNRASTARQCMGGYAWQYISVAEQRCVFCITLTENLKILYVLYQWIFYTDDRGSKSLWTLESIYQTLRSHRAEDRSLHTISLWLFSLLDLARFSSFLILYTDGRTPWTGDQPVARPPPTQRTTQTQNKRTQTSIPRVGFKPTAPVFERTKTVHVLERAATVISGLHTYSRENRGSRHIPLLQKSHHPFWTPLCPYHRLQTVNLLGSVKCRWGGQGGSDGGNW
jgi:hypothetical protein